MTVYAGIVCVECEVKWRPIYKECMQHFGAFVKLQQYTKRQVRTVRLTMSFTVDL